MIKQVGLKDIRHALARFGARLTLISPETLRMPSEIVDDLRASGCDITESNDLHAQVATADVIYMTRIQKERFPDDDEYLKVAGIYQLSKSDLGGAKGSMIIMHPLPRVDEINSDVDGTPHALYFEQAANGVVARMALLCRLLDAEIPEEVTG